MLKMKSLMSLLVFPVVLLLSFTSYSLATTMTLYEQMNVATMLETSSTALRMLQEAKGYDIGQTLNWTGTYSDSGWSYSTSGVVGGNPLTMSYIGSMSGTFGENITVSFLGSGNWGSDPINLEGKTTWFYDSLMGGYLIMDYDDSGKLGTDSWRWVVRGAEIIGGGGIGGYFGGWFGALTGATMAWTLSDIAFEVIESVTPPPPPQRPNPPSPLPNPPHYQPQPYQIIDNIYGSNNTVYTNDGGVIIKQGAWQSGQISGTTAVVPLIMPKIMGSGLEI
jgi:hypothetical protein